MNEKLLKPYDPKETEARMYKLWEESGYFNPDTCVKDGACKEDAEPFSIVLPPPNVTGTLHMGHAAMLAIEDIMVRYHRMNGKKTLWLPGTDHAAIATQSKVENILYKEEGKRKQDLGREEFLKRVEKFAQDSHDTIVGQMRKMGASVDWSREAFTLDEKRIYAVEEAFIRMHEDGLVYMGSKVVNWDPKGQTTISDDEIVYVERKTKLYTFKYWKDFPIAISTTRPETKVGDVAVAVHPDDERYQKFVGNTYEGSFCGVNLTIKIIADKSVEKAFGTGALGVTPAHSKVDEEISDRHNLPRPQIINEYARMINVSEELAGKRTLEAREIIVERLEKEGLLEKAPEEIIQNIATAERTGGIIEPLPKRDQFFIDVNKPISKRNGKTLKELMQDAVRSEKVKIIPERFEKNYFNWIDNLKDWNISRQIWYGHHPPVWYNPSAPRGKNGIPDYRVSRTRPDGDGWEKFEDTLDTWFSSGLWTFSALGWPDENAPDFKTFHPTTILETGYDILFFWVARMILMSGYLLGNVPFRTVYLHGLVRDTKGRKMSKSLGNIIDPVDMIEKYGADATRLSLIIGTGPGNDSKLSEDKIKGYKHFANKIWNVARFVLSNIEGLDTSIPPDLLLEDKKILAELEATIKEITEDIENYRFYLAGEKLYHYFWHTFADVILEASKPRLLSADEKNKKSAQWTLWKILETNLRALHPFMPFVTEEIWEMFPAKKKKLLIIETWPRTIT